MIFRLYQYRILTQIDRVSDPFPGYYAVDTKLKIIKIVFNNGVITRVTPPTRIYYPKGAVYEVCD